MQVRVRVMDLGNGYSDLPVPRGHPSGLTSRNGSCGVAESGILGRETNEGGVVSKKDQVSTAQNRDQHGEEAHENGAELGGPEDCPVLHDRGSLQTKGMWRPRGKHAEMMAQRSVPGAELRDGLRPGVRLRLFGLLGCPRVGRT